MSLTYQRSRITGAGLVAAQYDLTLERQTTMDNILFIPGIANPVSEINQLLFGQGQQGTFIAPSLTASLISGSTFGTGVETLPDLSPRNNPFSQATPSSRGAWFREPKRGRVNQIIHTEDATNAAWQLPTSDTFTNVTTTDENGATVNALRLAPTVANTTHQVRQTGLTSQNYSWSALMKADGETQVSLWIDAARAGRFTLTGSGTVSTAGSDVAASILSVGNGWYLCQMNSTVAGTIANIYLRTGAAYIGNINEAVLIRLPQCEPGTARTAYQRVTTAFDVTESGQRDCYGVRADGTDDGYATAGNVDFTGTPRVTVFAAVRKSSDATSGIIAELSNGSGEGRFALLGPSTNTTSTFEYFSRGTAFSSLVRSLLPAPTTRVITCQSDISLPNLILRVDGVQTQTTSSHGSGNYGSYPLYLLSRGGTSAPFNGNLYALIVAGGSYPLSTIQRVERILSRITPTVNL